MAENYDTLKENNLRQMVVEYENERQIVSGTCAKYKQYCHDLMQETALQKLEDIREKEIDLSEDPFLREGAYDPRSFLWLYRSHFYDNAEANLVRKYAMIYDAKNIDKYPAPTPLPRMEDLLDPYMPSSFTYETLKRLAAHCSKWRQK